MTTNEDTSAVGRTRSADRTATAEWVRRERSRMGLTRRAMAEVLGVHQQAVYELEVGKWVPTVGRQAALRAAWDAWAAVNQQPAEPGDGSGASTPAEPAPRRPLRRATIR